MSNIKVTAENYPALASATETMPTDEQLSISVDVLVEIERLLADIHANCERLDLFKKHVFYGKACPLSGCGTGRTLKVSIAEYRSMHAAMGILTEASELVDAVWRPESVVDWPNVREELGDLQWYAALLENLKGWAIADVLQTNIDKLRVRYPDGRWTHDRALNRDLAKERQELERDTSPPCNEG
jgi:NTP pyrophosphatase (non-canonical NTP hydrolase)